MNGAALWTSNDPPVQGLGLMRLTEEGRGDADRDPSALVHAAVQVGVTLLDTAEMYGNEELVGRAVAADRDQLLLCSKFGVYWGSSGQRHDWSVRADPATVRSSCEGSLRRLDVETIDLYYLHHRSDETPIEETVAAMAELRQSGKIRALGLSNVTVDDIRRAHAVHPIQAVQQEYSLVQREVESMMPVLAELGITLVAHSPLGHGALHRDSDSPLARVLAEIAPGYGVSPGQLALAWVHDRGRRSGQVVVPLPGTARVSHLLANIASAHLDIKVSDLERLETASV